MGPSRLCWYFATHVLLFLAIFSVFCRGQSGNFATKFITWDDMKVDLEVIRVNELREDRNRRGFIIVDKSGNGDSVTVQGAVDMIHSNNLERVKIFILPGIYREKVNVPADKPYISFIGDENYVSETVITWNDMASTKNSLGQEIGTLNSASVTIDSDFFCANSITFENPMVAYPGGVGTQAVALRIRSDKAMLYKIRVLGYQDTLLDDQGSHFFYKSYIQGSIDFIFGSGRSLYQECIINSIAETYGAIAAHHRDFPDEDTGFSFVNCTIRGSGTVFLGRAWGNYSRTVYSYCNIDNIILSEGWSDWEQPNRQRTAVFGEFECRGEGADRSKRVPWAKSFNFEDVRPYLDMSFIYGEDWLRL